MGERLGWLLLSSFAFGCDGASTALTYPPGPEDAGSFGTAGGGAGGLGGNSVGGAGGAGTGGGAGGAAGMLPDDSRAWIWSACGTIPYNPVEETTPRFDIMSLSMSADGSKLLSMGGDLLVWDVAPSFASSVATPAGRGAPERPKAELSPDGRWLAVSGDGWTALSVSGTTARVGSTFPEDGVYSCLYLQARFSPDGRWLAGLNWSGTIEIYAMSGVEMADQVYSPPVAALDVGCESIAFSPDGALLETSGGDRYDTSTWQALPPGTSGSPALSWRDSVELAWNGARYISTCTAENGEYECGAHSPFPKFSPDGNWMVAGATVWHRPSGERRVLDATALVGIFAPNGDVIAAGADNSLTRYCKLE